MYGTDSLSLGVLEEGGILEVIYVIRKNPCISLELGILNTMQCLYIENPCHIHHLFHTSTSRRNSVWL